MINPGNKNKGEFILQVQYAAAANVTNPLVPLTIPITPAFRNTPMNTVPYGLP